MDRTDYEFINYQPKFKPQILRLLSGLWGDDLEQNSAYFDWKYPENPYVDKVRMNLALHDEKVVGVRGFYAMCWQVGLSDKRILCLGDADAVVHPDHRRRGLLGSMTDSALENLADSPYEYIVTLSANKITSAFNLHLGWQNAGFVQTAIRNNVQGTAPQSGLRNFARNIPVLPSMYRRLRSGSDSAPPETTEANSTFQTFENNASAPGGSSGANISVDRMPEPGKMANLMEQIGDDSRIQHVRDQAYFAWRYQNPRSAYRFISWSSNQLEGYMVLRVPFSATDGSVTIVDWAAKGKQVYAELLQAAIELGDFYAINIWSETLSEDVKQLLSDNNFEFFEYSEDEESSYFPPQLLVRPIRDAELTAEWQFDGLDMLDINNWNLQAIDSDGS